MPGIRRICEDQPKRMVNFLEVFENVFSDHVSIEPRLFEIEPDRFDRFRMIIDKHGFGGAPA